MHLKDTELPGKTPQTLSHNIETRQVESKNITALPGEAVFVDAGYLVEGRSFDKYGLSIDQDLRKGLNSLRRFLKKPLLLDRFLQNDAERSAWIKRQQADVQKILSNNRLSTRELYLALKAIDVILIGLDELVEKFPEKRAIVSNRIELIRPHLEAIASISSRDKSQQWLNESSYQNRLAVLSHIEVIASQMIKLFEVKVNRIQYTLENPRQSFVETIQRLGIFISSSPDPKKTSPSEFLARGENFSRNLGIKKSLEPTAGKNGDFGVFLGDTLTCLMYKSESGIYYIFSKEDIAKDWLLYYGQSFNEMMQSIASNNKLDLSKYGDGLDAEQQVFKQHAIYQANLGIATSPNKLDVSKAKAIILTPDIATPEVLSQFDDSLLAVIAIAR